MARVFSALPVRGLRARPPGSRARAAWSSVGVLMFGGMLAFVLVFFPPGLVTDWQVRGSALTLRDGTVRGSDCNSSDLLEICSMTIAAPIGTAVVQRRVHYAFVSSQDTPITVHVVADPAHPGWLTTDLGLDVFWDRLAMLVGVTVMLSCLVFGGGWAALRSYRRSQVWQRTDSLAVALQLVSRQRLRSGEIWTVRSGDGQTTKWAVPRRSTPFTLGSADKILGLQLIDGSEIMPLDEKLRWVDLSPTERASALGTAHPREGQVGRLRGINR